MSDFEEIIKTGTRADIESMLEVEITMIATLKIHRLNTTGQVRSFYSSQIAKAIKRRDVLKALLEIEEFKEDTG